MPRSSKTGNSEQGSSGTKGEPRFLAVGRILRPHGVHGDVLMQVLTEFPDRVATLEVVYLGDGHQPAHVESARRHGEDMLLKLAEVRTRDEAETHRGTLVSIELADAADLPPGRYYFHQIEGLRVVTEDGEELGRVTEILETGANDVYVVRGDAGEILLPAIQSVIREIDLDAGKMIVRLMEGLR